MSELKRQLPNVLTIMRILLAFLCSYYAFYQDIRSLTISLVLFCIASATDYFDGYLARKWKIVSSFGKLMDPIADKVLILGVLLVFAVQGIVPLVLTILIFFREILLTILRLVVSNKVVMASRYSGKVKTFSQVIVLVIIYITLIYTKELMLYVDKITIQYVINGLVMWLAIISIYSAIDFLYYNRKIMKSSLGIS